MSGDYKQMQRHEPRTARHMLDERLAREDMGDSAYEEMISHADDRAFRIFGIVFIAVFAVVILGVIWLGY